MLVPLPSLRVYYAYSAAGAFLFGVYALLASVYRIEVVGLGPLELILVGTVLEATVFLFELPTGVVADAVSRRLSVILGVALTGAGFLLEGLVPSFGAVLAAQVLWGVGVTFTSGAEDAWISDEVGESTANRAFLRAAQLALGAGLVAIPVATLLGRSALGLPLVVAGAGHLLLALALLLTMGERPFERIESGSRNPLRAAAGVARRGLELTRRRPLLWTIYAVALFVGASSETYDRLWEAKLLRGTGFPDLDPALVFGALGAIGVLLGIVVTEVARRRLDVERDAALLGLLLPLAALQSLAVALFGLMGRFDIAVGLMLVISASRGLQAPLYRAWLNRQLEPATRATAFSAAGQADALGQIAGGPLLGLVASAAGMPPAFVLAAALLAPACLLYLRALRRARAAAI